MSVNMTKIQKGYKQTEIGVIPEDWEVKRLGDVCEIKTGKKDVNEGDPDGDYPFFTCSRNHTYSGSFSFDCEAVLIAGNGEVGNLSYYKGKFEAYQRTYVLSQFSISIEYLWCQLNARFKKSLGIGTIGSSIPYIKMENITDFTFAIPIEGAEQKTIASVLLDTDALIEKLAELIEKKKAIKQATMQQLLTGKKRLTGFSGEWEVRRLGEILKVKHGKNQHDIESINGKYPILGTGGEMGRTDHFLCDKPSVMIGRKGTIDVPRYMETPFWTVDTLFYTEIEKDNSAKFLFYKFQMIDWYSYNEASGVPSLNAKTIERIEICLPLNGEEQNAIATILSDMDAEIEALEKEKAKYQVIKQGMMQSLLTGAIRLAC